jgi:hypothetical protein
MPCLGVFKVPHHGSARNSLLDKNLLTTKADDNWNELHYFLTVLLCSNRELFRELPEGVQGEGLDLLDDVFVDAIAEWIGLSKGFRDRDRFCIILDDLGSILVKYFEVTKTVIQEGNTIYSLHDANRAANLLWLTTFLVTRHRNMQRACYSKNAKLEDLRNVANVIKKLLPKFTRQDFETFALNNLPKILPPQGVHTRARAQGYISPEYGEMIECLFSAEPYGIICAQVSIFNFYHRFQYAPPFLSTLL